MRGGGVANIPRIMVLLGLLPGIRATHEEIIPVYVFLSSDGIMIFFSSIICLPYQFGKHVAQSPLSSSLISPVLDRDVLATVSRS